MFSIHHKEIFANTTDTGHTHEVHTPQEQKLDLELVWMTLEPSSEEDGIDDENVLDEGDD